MQLLDILYIIAVCVANFFVVKKVRLATTNYRLCAAIITTILFNFIMFFVSVWWLMMLNIGNVAHPEYKMLVIVYMMGPLNLLATIVAILATRQSQKKQD